MFDDLLGDAGGEGSNGLLYWWSCRLFWRCNPDLDLELSVHGGPRHGGFGGWSTLGAVCGLDRANALRLGADASASDSCGVVASSWAPLALSPLLALRMKNHVCSDRHGGCDVVRRDPVGGAAGE